MTGTDLPMMTGVCRIALPSRWASATISLAHSRKLKDASSDSIPTRLTTATIPGFPAGDNLAVTGGFVQASNAKNPIPGIALVQPSLVPSDKNNFAPRIGIAWQPLSNSNRLVVRGGYGIYYDRANSRLLNNQLLDFPYYTLAQTYLTPIATPVRGRSAAEQLPPGFQQFGGLSLWRSAGVNAAVANSSVAHRDRRCVGQRHLS